MIKCAAIQRIKDGRVWTGHRHGNIIQSILIELGENPLVKGNFVQGFITHKGKFLNRQEAYKVAVNCGQIKDEQGKQPILTSEDLY